MYSAKVMDHFANPRNVGEIENADGVGEVGNPKCGDIMKMFLKIDNSVITDVKFKTFGCGAAIATSSIATEMIKGKTIDEALKLTPPSIMSLEQSLEFITDDELVEVTPKSIRLRKTILNKEQRMKNASRKG